MMDVSCKLLVPDLVRIHNSETGAPKRFCIGCLSSSVCFVASRKHVNWEHLIFVNLSGPKRCMQQRWHQFGQQSVLVGPRLCSFVLSAVESGCANLYIRTSACERILVDFAGLRAAHPNGTFDKHPNVFIQSDRFCIHNHQCV